MNWRAPGDRYSRLTEDGRYSVCAVGFEGRYTWEAWRTRSHPDGAHMIATGLRTEAAAMRICEEDDRRD